MNMNKLILTIFATLLILTSCKVDCPDKSYELWISIHNRTGNDIEVNLYPKQEYLWNNYSYKPCPNCGNHKDKNFVMEYDSLESWSDKNRLYLSLDTSIKPSELLSKVFDSIIIEVNNENATELKFFHEHSINYLENPFTNDSIWDYEKYEDHFPNNDCENKVEIKDYTYYFEQNLIEDK
jgi:hypothetical protein